MKKLLLFFFVLFAAAATAQTITWDGSDSNLWNNPANWDLNILPTASHDVVIPSGSDVSLNVSATINSIWVQGAATLAFNNSLSVSDVSSFDSGATINWSAGSLTGGATVTNYGTINLLTTSNKQIIGAAVLNNQGAIVFLDSGDLYITDGVLNNQVAGIIDMRIDAGNLSYSGGGSHLLNNMGLIKRTASAGTAEIECLLHNTGTVAVESGTLQFSIHTMELDNGIYNVAAGTVLHWASTQIATGILSGLVDGEIRWTSTVNVPAAQSTTFNFTGTGAINWLQGTLGGSGTLTNESKIQLSSTSNKLIIGGTTLNNQELITFIDGGDLYIADATLNNMPDGTIDMQFLGGNLSYTGGGSHVLNNYGIIKKTGSATFAMIECELHNVGTIDVQTGNLSLNYAGIELSNGLYNISAGAFLSINNVTTVRGVLSGLIAGEIIWTSTINIPSNESATFGFTGVGTGNINWQQGSLGGGGTLTNNFTMRMTTTSNKQVIGATTLNNDGLFYFQSSGDLYISDGIVNNLAGGVIDLRTDEGNISYSGGGSHVLNNFGLIKKTTSAGNATIESVLHNYATLTVESGTMSFQVGPTYFHGGTYNVATGTTMEWRHPVVLDGTLNGLVNGDIVWLSTVSVSTAANLAFSGAGGINWAAGSLNGGGNLVNAFTLRLATTANKTIFGSSTLQNDALMVFTDSGDLYVSDGTLNNMAAGIIDMQADAGNLSYSGGGSHILNNFGLIKRTTTIGTASIESELHNMGTLSIQSGTLTLGINPIHLNGGIYDVSSGATLHWQGATTVSGVLEGQIDGQLLWTSDVFVPASAEFNFVGSGHINWNGGALNGGGVLTNNAHLELGTTTNKQITGSTTLNNGGIIAMVDSGDLFISNGTMNNLASGVIDLMTDAANISYSGGGTHTLNNYGLIKKSVGSGTSLIQSTTTNYGTIDVQSGTIGINTFPFLNDATGTIMGTGTIELPGAPLFSNQGTFAPGGSPGTLNVTGNYDSANSSVIAVDLGGLTQETQYDVMNISGNAVFNGDITINLGFAPSIGDSFTVVNVLGNISTCNLNPSETAVRESLVYTFGVMCVANDAVVLTVTDIKALPPTASEQEFCAGATVAYLEAEGDNLQWYAAPSGGTALASNVVLESGFYYVSQTVNGFESDRTEVEVTVNTTPAPSATAQSFTGSATVADLEATGTDLRWYDNAALSNPLAPSTPVATGTYYVTQTLNDCESEATAVSVTVNDQIYPFYVDSDGDGFGAGDLVNVPASDPDVAPEGYSLNNTDCDDADADAYQSADMYIDEDGDGYHSDNVDAVCYGAEVPEGYSLTTLGEDCDDTDANAWQSADVYVDMDGDGFHGEMIADYCYGSSLPQNYSTSTDGEDCDDSD
ncbi:MAG TPA: hypothetical protein VF676_10035, partial [Flavobacterium sp.]